MTGWPATPAKRKKAPAPEPDHNLDAFTALILPIMVMEGGYTNNPADKGGETNFGVTEVEARRFGYIGAMADMSPAEAEQIYKTGYWVGPQFDRIDLLMPTLAWLDIAIAPDNDQTIRGLVAATSSARAVTVSLALSVACV